MAKAQPIDLKKISAAQEALSKEYRHILFRFTHSTKLNYVLFSILFAQVLYAVHFVLAFYYGEPAKLLYDLNYVVLVYFAFALASVSYLSSNFVSFFSTYAKKVAMPVEKARQKYEGYLKYMFAAKFYVPYAICCACAYFMFVYFLGAPYYAAPAITMYGFYFLSALGGFLAGCAVYQLLAGIYVLYKISQDDLPVDIYSVDRCGGFKVFGSEALRSVFFFFIIVILIGIVAFFGPTTSASPAITLTYSGLAISLLLAGFFAPLFFFHKTLVKFKQDEENAIDAQIAKFTKNESIRDPRKLLEELASNKPLSDKISILQSNLEKISDLSSWPFDASLISQLISILMIPFILTLIQVWAAFRAVD